ncbi:hypothetical protein BZA77DRAFT_369945 [Pyronema omphalodes]|nr:hypothetical protein BZA77DRAFT_369945 [Pyronema omphalodes]
MEIESAYQAMVSALPFDERGLAEEILTHKHYEKRIGSVYWRAPVLDMGDAFREITKVADGGQTRRIALYCDTLIIPSSYTIPLSHESGLRIAIYAREIQFDTSQPFAFRFNMVRQSMFGLYTLKLPSNFSIQLNLLDGDTQTRKLEIEPGFFGVSVEFKDTITVKQVGPPEGEMRFADYLQNLNEDGTWKDEEYGPVYKNDNLPRLLFFQFLVATFVMQHRQLQPLALGLLQYICAATKDAKSTAVFNIQASVMLSSLLAQVNTNVSYVPIVNIRSAKQVLKARLLAAQAFESRFQSFISQGRETTNWAISAGLVLDASEAAIEEYSFLEIRARKQYEEAQIAYEKAFKNVQENQKMIAEASAVFKRGVEKFKAEKDQEAIKEIFTAFIGVAISIGACVATGGAAAPVAAPAIISGVQTAGKFAAIWAKLKQIFDKLHALYKKLEPAIKKMAELVKLVMAMVNATKAWEDREKKFQLTDRKALTESHDLVNGISEWERMKIDIGFMFDGIRECGHFEGAGEYEKQLQYLPVNGLALLAAQEAVIKAGDQVVVMALKRRLQNEQRKRIKGAQAHIAKDDRVLDILKRAMFDRLLAVRSMVFMDFWSYTAAYMYHSLDQVAPVQLSALKPIHDYADDAARLQGALGSLGTYLKIQQKTFTLNTLCGFSSAADLRARLESGGSVRFKVDVEDEMFQRFCRVRMCRARCYLDGVKASGSDSNLSLKLSTEASFFDIDLPRHLKEKKSNGEAVDFDTRSFVGERRTLLFEYDLNDKTILCDGEYLSESDYTTFSPFTTWSVAIDRGFESSGLNFDELNWVKLEILCEVTLRQN